MTNKTATYTAKANKAYYDRNKNKEDFKEKKSESNRRYYEKKKKLELANDKIIVVKLDNTESINIIPTESSNIVLTESSNIVLTELSNIVLTELSNIVPTELSNVVLTETNNKDCIRNIIDSVYNEFLNEIEKERISEQIDAELSNNNYLLECDLIEILNGFNGNSPRFSILKPDLAKKTKILLTKSALLMKKVKHKKTLKNGNSPMLSIEKSP
jgi:hypothetical protein